MAEQYKLIHPVKYYRDHLNQNIRPDGRGFDKLRPLAINVGSISSADGSAIVKIGNTSLVCGIRAELAKPKATESDCGYLVPHIELTSLYSKKARPGSMSSEEAEVYTCALNDILVNSACLDLKDLCICKEKLVWCLYCDVVCLDNDGSVLDAALLAVVAALHNLTLPTVKHDPSVDKTDVDTSKRVKVDIKSSPVSTSFIVFDDSTIVVDPTSEEENLSSATLTIASTGGEVCYVFKPGGTPFSQQQMDNCIKQALFREKSVVKLLEDIVKTKV